MIKPTALTFLLFTCQMVCLAQKATVYSSDLTRFWKAYDRVIRITDTAVQRRILQQKYLDKGSPGLQDFIKLRGWTAERFRSAINDHPQFWVTVRQKTKAAASLRGPINSLIKKYRKLYPNFKKPEIYFLVGHIETGGTTTQTRVLLGTEVLSADSTVNASGLHPMLQEFFKTNHDLLSLVAHELTHTQQRGGDMETRRKSNLLGFALAEGSCEFIAELLTGQFPARPYMTYGRIHEKELWQKFKTQMYGTETKEWLYNGGYKQTKNADLGYYIGYIICKAYYNRMPDKVQAIADIVQLDFEDLQGLDQFLSRSSYGLPAGSF